MVVIGCFSFNVFKALLQQINLQIVVLNYCFYHDIECQWKLWLLIFISDTIMNQIKEAGFSISQVKETKLTREMAEEFYKDHKGKDFFNNLVDYMSQWVDMFFNIQDLQSFEFIVC